MSMFLQKLIEMSIYGGIAAVIVILFRAVFRRYPKRITIFFWLIVGIRFLCPFNFDSQLSLMNLIASNDKAEIQTVKISDPDELNISENAVVIKVDKTVTDYEPSKAFVQRTIRPSLDFVAFTVWGSGLAILLTAAGVRYVKVHRFVKKCRKTACGLIHESDDITTPIAAGFLHPIICIPSDIEAKEREYLLAHEKIHIKNHDNITKTAGFLIACIHWFNPLVWLSYILFCSDLEMRCDEKVLDTLGHGIKKAYCRSLVIHSIKDQDHSIMSTAFSGLGFGSMEVKMRIKNLLNYKKTSKIAAIFLLCFTFGIVTVLTACASEDGSDSVPPAYEVSTSPSDGDADDTRWFDVDTDPDPVITYGYIITSGELEDYDYSNETYCSTVEEMIDSGYEYLGAEFLPAGTSPTALYLKKDNTLKVINKNPRGLEYWQILNFTETMTTPFSAPFDIEIFEDEYGYHGIISTKDHVIVEIENDNGSVVYTWNLDTESTITGYSIPSDQETLDDIPDGYDDYSNYWFAPYSEPGDGADEVIGFFIDYY